MKKLFLSFVLIILGLHAFSQGATCATATTLTVNGGCGGAATISDVTMEGPAPSCAVNPPVREAWYVFTNASLQNIIITGDISNRNLAIQLFSGACGSVTEIACENSGGAGTDEVLTRNCLAAGTYYVRITNVGNNDMSLVSLCITSTACTSIPPANDDPCSATALTVGTSCSFTGYTNANATASTGVPAPGCASYNGGDVWFTAVVPSSGSLTFDSNTGVMTDGGMALYSGTCGSLTLISCNDDGSTNGLMPMIAQTGLTPGATIWIRFWEFSNDNNGTFSLCVFDPCPPCAGSPTGGSAVSSLASTSCASPTTTLSLSGASTGCNFTYQWQSSPNNSVWTNIPGATSSTYSTGISATTYFRCVITCILSGLSSNSSSVMVTTTATPPANDDPCNATALTVGASCSFSSYTNSCSSGSSGVPAPGCSSYNGGDVWFTVTVPAGGSLEFDSNTGVITDGGMAIYSGTCTNLTLIDCDDDGSTNGAMSYISATGLTPGSTIFIRFWEYGGDNNGTFSICVYDPCPPCSGTPTGGTASAAPASTTCGSPNTTLSLTGSSGGCTNTFQWQSSPDNVTWTNISGATAATLTTPVTTNTYFRCVITCILSGLSANSTSVLVTTSIANSCSFTVSTPAYSPDAAYTAGTLLTFPDDEMSSVLPIGFTFCFMGTNYTNFVVSSNAFISFNTANAGAYSSYTPQAIPTSTPVETLNSIMFPWHDVDPSVGTSSDIRYITLGTAPNRKLVVNFSIVPMFSFSCNSMLYTGQVVLNETTNIIETYIQDKPICSTWVGGRAVHGINGPDGCSGVAVPGRNNTVWTVTNDAKMFTPTGCCNTALAAEIIVLEATQIEDNLNQVKWVTATENNLEKFIIEKSENGNDFTFLKEMPAAGNSSTERHYSIEDNRPFDRITYYRIKQVDYDGVITYSNIVSVNNNQWNGFALLNLYPNPSTGIVYSDIYAADDMNFTIEIRDITGRIVRTERRNLVKGDNINDYDITDLTSGVYMFTFIDETTGKTTSMKFTKN